jgi:hypothetical protein
MEHKKRPILKIGISTRDCCFAIKPNESRVFGENFHSRATCSLAAFQLHVTPAAGSSNNCHMINKSGCRFLNIIGPHFLSSLSRSLVLGRLLLFRGIIIFGNDSRMSFLVRAAW